MADGNSVRKCAAQAIRAVALLSGERPNLKLVMAGERGDDHPALSALVNELGLGDRVTFPGRITLDEKVLLLQRCAVYLQPSLFEGFGLAAAEAMSCGAPVITSDVGAVREVCADTVRYVDGSNPDDIATEVRFLLDRPVEREILGQSARRRIVELFSPERRRRGIAATIQEITQ
jgi:glycosyltransferase involved in cell wall biosynthesis